MSGVPPLCLALGLIVLMAVGPVAAQSLPEALDTPGLTWTAFGSVTTQVPPALTYDGEDAVQVAPMTSSTAAASGISTPLAGRSVVECWFGSEGINNDTVLSVPPHWETARGWRKGQFLVEAGSLAITNAGTVPRGVLRLDQVSVRPPVITSLEEALDLPVSQGAVVAGPEIEGLAEGWLAPDGQDAALLLAPVAFSASAPGPTIITYRSRDRIGQSAVRVIASNGTAFPTNTRQDRTWAYHAGGGGSVRGWFSHIEGASPPAMLDAVGFLAPVPPAEALDVAGLEFNITGPAAGTTRPPEGSDDDAVVIWGAEGGGGRISTTIPGPALVRFLHQGNLIFHREGLPDMSLRPYTVDGSSGWVMAEIPLSRAVNRVAWSAEFSGGWLNALTVIPGHALADPGAQLGLPGYQPELLGNPILSTDAGGLSIATASLIPAPEPEALLRFPLIGPAVASLRISDASERMRVRLNGGLWQAPAYFSHPAPVSFTPFTPTLPWLFPITSGGAQFLEVSGPAVLRQLEFIPLEIVSLNEALEAPELTFTTSPGLPWLACRTPEGAGFSGQDAACGGVHAASGDPWIETTVQGPGVLTFRFAPSTLDRVYTRASNSRVPLVEVNSSRHHLKEGEGRIVLPSGPQTIRWWQPGSRITQGEGTLWWLDQVAFQPAPRLAWSEALDTPGRTWTMAGEGLEEIVPLLRPVPSEWDPSLLEWTVSPTQHLVGRYLETMVQLPCFLSLQGTNIRVTDGTGKVLLAGGTFSFIRSENLWIPGHGLARLRFLANDRSKAAVLQRLDFTESTGEQSATIGPAEGNPVWTGASGAAWKEYRNPANGATAHLPPPDRWIETVVTGPCTLTGLPSSSVLMLPEYQSRSIPSGRIAYAGRQRVLVQLPSTSSWFPFMSSPPSSIPAWPLAAATGAPLLTWTTGGDVPWAAFSQDSVTSPPLWPGEISWLETRVTGPGVLRWKLQKPQTRTSPYAVSVLVNQRIVSSFYSTYLHVGPGLHTIRWEASMASDAPRNVADTSVLSFVNFTPQPTGSVCEILNAPDLAFVESSLSGGNFGLPPWPVVQGWKSESDPGRPDPVLRKNSSDLVLLTAVTPGPGVLSMDLMMNPQGAPGTTINQPLDGQTGTNLLPSMAAPFFWQRWNSAVRLAHFPARSGFAVSVDNVAFHPHTTIPLGEALDQPALTWTTGGSRPDLWHGLQGPSPGLADQGAAWLKPMTTGETAWMETTLTGPLTVTTTFVDTWFSTRYSTEFMLSPEPVFTIQINGVPLRPDLRPVYDFHLPAGTHTVRWSATPRRPIYEGQAFGIRNIQTKTPAWNVGIPDVAAMLDSPGLTWAAPSTLTVRNAPANQSRDGVDALQFFGEGALLIPLQGPGIASFWFKPSSATTSLQVGCGSISFSLPPAATSGLWQNYRVPISSGLQYLSILPSPTWGYMDEFSWLPLPALPVHAALDLPEEAMAIPSAPDRLGAASWPGWAEDGEDALLIMPGRILEFERPIPGHPPLEIRIPPRGRVTFRVRGFGANTQLAFTAQTTAGAQVGTSWTTMNYTAPGNGQSLLTINALNGPLLLDRMTITPPPAGAVNYLPWAAAAGIPPSLQHPGADADGDGFANALEYSVGSDPADPIPPQEGTATQPGLNVTTVVRLPDTGLPLLEIRYWKRTHQKASVETAEDPTGWAQAGFSPGWTVSPIPGTITSPGPAGWQLVTWRSAALSSNRIFSRVRFELP